MTRLMGDATHQAVPQLAAIRSRLQLVAGYDTGSPDIIWTAGDWALFPGIPHVTIDQAFTGSPNLTAIVRDVETGAWTPAAAVNRAGWNVPRPTIYCNQNTLPAVLADGWQGDLWLAIVSWLPGDFLPSTPGCTVVAVQSDYTNPAYDLSYVLDPAWPAPSDPPPGSDMLIIWGTTAAYLLSGGKLHKITAGEAALYQSAGIPQTTGPVATDAEIASLLADFPPGQPVVTVPPVTVTFPVQKLSGTLTPS